MQHTRCPCFSDDDDLLRMLTPPQSRPNDLHHPASDKLAAVSVWLGNRPSIVCHAGILILLTRTSKPWRYLHAAVL